MCVFGATAASAAAEGAAAEGAVLAAADGAVAAMALPLGCVETFSADPVLVQPATAPATANDNARGSAAPR
jgi:hypothetical protein